LALVRCKIPEHTAPVSTAIAPVRRRLQEFVKRINRLTELDWGFVYSGRLSDDDTIGARIAVADAITVAGRGPTAELRALNDEARKWIDLLAEDAGFTELARNVAGGQGPQVLAEIAKSAAYGLLVSNMPDFEIEGRTISPRRAAQVLYTPFRDVVPMAELG